MDLFVLLWAGLLFAFLGSLLGIVTGMAPGLHVNNVALLVVAFSGALAGIIRALLGWADPSEAEVALLLSALIIGNVMTHAIVDFVPSIFLGAPDPETALSVLPGHRLLMEGRGYEAVSLAAFGGMTSVLVSLALLLPMRLIMGTPIEAYEALRPVMPFVLMLIVALLIITEAPMPPRRRFIPHSIASAGSASVEGDGLDHPGPPPPMPVQPPYGNVGIEGVLRRTWLGYRLRGEALDLEVVAKRGSLPEGPVVVEGEVVAARTALSYLAPRGLALGLFLMAGALGYVALSVPGFMANNWYPLPSLAQDAASVVLFPLFTGLFGISNLLLSWATNASLPPQSLESRGGDLSRKRKTRAVLGGSLAGAIVGWFPGIGGASATTLAKLLAGDREEGGEEEGREVIMAMAGVNASTAVFTMVALFIILRARSGTMVAIQELTATSLQPWEPFTSPPTALVLLLMAATLASLLGFLYAFALGRLLARHASRVPYRSLVATVTVLLVLLIFLFTGPLGLAVASVATAVGLLPPLLGVRRVHLMGALLLPVIVFLLGL